MYEETNKKRISDKEWIYMQINFTDISSRKTKKKTFFLENFKRIYTVWDDSSQKIK